MNCSAELPILLNERLKGGVVMANCPLLENCIFFRDEMGDKPDLISKSFKIRFCNISNAQCARWQVYSALGKDGVPGNLYPNQDYRVLKLIQKYKENI